MTAEQSIRNIERTMDAVNATLRDTPKPDPRADLVDLFERYAERGNDDQLYIDVETAADLVVDNDWQQGTEITDAQVEVAAREIDHRAFDLTSHRYEIETDNRWDGAQEFARESARNLARRVLEAAMGVQS